MVSREQKSGGDAVPAVRWPSGRVPVADHVFLGREVSRFGLTRPAEGNRAATALLTRLGHPEIRPTAEVGSREMDRNAS